MFALSSEFDPPCLTDTERFLASEEQAKAICGTCRVQLICLSKALEYEELAGERLRGVHGGLNEAERANTKLTRIA
jgi:hypothetical protein